MKKLFLLSLTIIILFSLLAACSLESSGSSSSSSSKKEEPAPPSWKIVMNEDFEGVLSGSYQRFDNDGAANGEYYWAKSTFQKYAGSNSLWAIGGGVDGSALSSGTNYPDNCQSWLITGPYDFSKATDVRGSFYYWLNSESGTDYFKFGFSTNGVDYTCASISGVSGGWAQKDMGLVSVKAQITGKSQVWFAFIFNSSALTNYQGGAYVDNILIEKYE